MKEVVTDRGEVIVGKKKLNVDEARELMRTMRMKQDAGIFKSKKLHERIRILNRFIDEAKGKNITLSKWLASKGLDFRKFYTSVGYYTPVQAVVSDDDENELLIYHRNMVFNKEAGYHVPKRNIVEDEEHQIVTSSNYGFTYNPKIGVYFPKTIFDTDVYSSADGDLDESIHLMGGFTLDDIGDLSVRDYNGEELVNHMIEIYSDEYDNVEGELDTINSIQQELYDSNYSNAEGGKNFVCRSACGVKHPFNRSKRRDCNADCNEKYPPTEGQMERQENRYERQDIRKETREARRRARQRMRQGEISRQEFRDRKKELREKKRKIIKETGGNFFARAWKGVAKVMPLTLAGRGGALVLIGENAFGFATRVAPALLPPSEARSKFEEGAIKDAKKAWVKLSRAWENLGGNPDKLKEKIIKGYRKKPMKIRKKSGFDGMDSYSFDNTLFVEDYSNAEPVTIATAITTGLATLAGLITTIVEARKNPYKSGKEPQDFKEAMKEGALEDPKPDPYAPKYDPNSGEWIDPSTGRPIDPVTGEFKDNILGMNKWLAIGIGVALVASVVLIVTKTGKGKAKGG